MSVVRRLVGAGGAVFSTVVVASMLSATAADAATTYIVDNTVAACSDTGPGSQAQPFCTIAAGAKVAQPGDTVLVAAGTYSGTSVDPANSGAASSPITFTANAGVTVSGGTRAFSISNRNYIVINGFTITGTSSYGIYVSGGSNNVVSHNSVSSAGQPVSGSAAAGIYIDNLTGGTVSGNVSHDNSAHGITLVGSTTGVTVAGNTSYHNAYQYQRSAEGINDIAPGNSIIGNVTYANEDTGINIYPGADNTLVADNVSYGNGDHGIDNHDVTGGQIIGNTVFHNCTDGINVEGTSGNYDIENNISTDNATGAVINPTPINPPGAYTNDCNRRVGNIGVYDSAPATTTANDNLVWQDGPGAEYAWAGTAYNTRTALNAATGQEANGIFADPMFANAAASNLQLTAGSPAIDSANSGASGEQPTDLVGNARVDVPAVPNTGSGPRPYDDRGAYEFQPGGPTAQLQVSPASGTAPLAVTLDASASAAGNAAITSYTFDFGDGTTAGPQAAAKATHTYTSAGTYTAKVTVTDSDGLTSAATQPITVQSPATHFIAKIGTGHATTRQTSDSVTVPSTGHVAAGHLIVVTVQLTGAITGTTVTGKDSAGDRLNAVTNASDRFGDRLAILSGVAKNGLAGGSKITITFPSASANRITADEVAGVTTVDRHSAAAGSGAQFSSKATGTTSRPGEFVFAATATFGGTSVSWSTGWSGLGAYILRSNALTRAYRIPAGVGSFAGTGTTNAPRWLAEVAAFK